MPYWISDWLDEFDIRRPWDVFRALGTQGPCIQRLRELAECGERSANVPILTAESLLAGSGLDLTGDLGCYHTRCRRSDVDKLFHKAWQYFDRIVVTDQITHWAAVHWDEMWQVPQRHALIRHILVVLYLREVGADDLVEFRPKILPGERADSKAFRRDAVTLSRFGAEAARTLEEEASIHQLSDDPRLWIANHSLLGHMKVVQLSASATSANPRRAVARAVVRQFARYLLVDIQAASRLNLPLGAGNAVHRGMLENTGHRTTRSVAFELNLPVLENLPIAQLLEIRREHAEAFGRFRDALRRAIKERVTAEATQSSEGIASEIVEDLLEPELRLIRAQLRTAKNLLNKRLAINAGVGALVTTCGLLSGIAPAALAGLALPSLMSADPVATYLDKKAEIEMKDLFFLWEAARHTVR